MKSCCKCGKELLSGLIVCRECSNINEVPLRYYKDQLAEEFVLEYSLPCCELCIYHESCVQKQSGLTCRNGVKTFLVDKINYYSAKLKADIERNKQYYDLLDCKYNGNSAVIDDMLQTLMVQNPGLNVYQARAIVFTWFDIRNNI